MFYCRIYWNIVQSFMPRIGTRTIKDTFSNNLKILHFQWPVALYRDIFWEWQNSCNIYSDVALDMQLAYTRAYTLFLWAFFFFTLTFQELSQLNQRNGNQCSGLSLIIVTEKIVVKVWWNDFMELKMLYNWKFCLSLLIILMAIKDYLYIMWFPQSYKKNVSNKQKIQQQTTKHPRLMP